ncbi:MAG: hypothetical protein HY530_00160 [Chloroflexi bacterium]|nr:hypothetical protein [Chloroflexota bacterium]
MWISKDDIQDRFKRFIFGFIFNDIDQCIKAKANYVVALALLSYTEYLVALVSGKIGLQGDGGKSFGKALEYFPGEYKRVDDSIVIQYRDKAGGLVLDKTGKPKQERGIYKLFRCGLAHEYFMKGVGRVNNNENGYADPKRIGIELDDIPENDSLYSLSPKRFTLYTNEYFRDFKVAAEKIHQKLLAEFDADQRSAGKGQSELLTDSDVKSPLLKGFSDSLKMYSSREIV